MPYIKDKDRFRVDPGMGDQPFDRANNAGELNFQLTRICQMYEKNNDVPSYRIYNDIIGALECCKQEFYRRVVVPYETQKCHDNGDVY